MYGPGTTAVAEGATGFAAHPSGVTTAGGSPVTPPSAAGAAPPGAARTQGPTAVAASGVTLAAAVMAGAVSAPAADSSRELPCAGDPDLFFAESPEDVEAAKALCCGCPMRLACFTGAVERREPWGVWGGELFLRGEVIPRKRPRGRPRKSEIAA